MSIIDLFSTACLLTGTAFFFGGTVALLRFPDVYTRLHALSKADNIGLGFVLLGLLPHTAGVAEALKLVLVWLLVLVASASVSFLIARRARTRHIRPWTHDEKTS